MTYTRENTGKDGAFFRLPENIMDETQNNVNAQETPVENIPAQDAPEAQAPADGISFSGGAENAYIRQFAETPQYGRTMEEIEQEGASTVSEETRERFRAQARRRQAETGAPSYTQDRASRPQPNASSGWMIGGKVSLVDPLDDAPSSYIPPRQQASYPDALVYPETPGDGTVEFTPQRDADYVQPAAVGDDVPMNAPAGETPEHSVPKTRFEQLFSTKKNFAVFTIIAGVINALWDFLYLFTVMLRSVAMSTAENAMRLAGRTAYTFTFESPLIGLLKFFMFLLPVLALVWAILFKKADGQKYYYNKKIVIVFLCLIALSMLLAVIDLTALHLLG